MKCVTQDARKRGQSVAAPERRFPDGSWVHVTLLQPHFLSRCACDTTRVCSPSVFRHFHLSFSSSSRWTHSPPLPHLRFFGFFFFFFFFTVISLRNQYFQSPILCGTCSSQAFKPLHSIKIGHDEALSSHLIAKSNGQLSVFMLLSLSTG